MSHFSVLVIGDNVEAQLAPYHEFECTGEDNQYVQTIDKTEESRAKYAEATTTRYRTPDGVLHSLFNERGEYRRDLFRDPLPGETRPGPFDGDHKDGTTWSRGKVLEIPADWVKVQVPVRELERAAEWCAEYYGHAIVPHGESPNLTGPHKYGYTLVDEAGEMTGTFRRTNPNAKWDWYQTGGRWGDFFKTASGNVDQCRKGQVDVEGMRADAAVKAAATFDKFELLTKGLPPAEEWDSVFKRFNEDRDAAGQFYRNQPIIKALRGDREAMWWNLDDFQCSRAEYIARARAAALRTFAVVKDGQWYEKGRMGWWACVADEKDEEKWTSEFNALIAGLPDDTLLTIVDCHI